MSFFKFSPDLMLADELQKISVGRKHTVEYIINKLSTAAEKSAPLHVLIIGQRGIGKTHLLLSIFHTVDHNRILPIRLSEEEYSVTSIEDLLERILNELNATYRKNQILDDAIRILKGKKTEGKLPVVFVDNVQMLFNQMKRDLPKLRALLQKDNLFCIIGSALSIFDEISSYDEPFYNFFEQIYLKGLEENETSELIEKRLQYAGKNDIAERVPRYRSRIKGIRILTGGNPRLIHSVCEILIQKNSLVDLEKNVFTLLDNLTPYYQARMESLPVEKRKIIDILALADGPLSPTELAQRAKLQINSVITQVRRLEGDGILEPVRFRKKKSIRYQVTEGLYRIWREMRSPLGMQRINLFVDFLKIWYSEEELFQEYYEKVNRFNEAVRKSTVEAKAYLTHMCYVSDTLPELRITYLPDRVEKFARVGDKESAEKEIERARRNSTVERNEPLRLSNEIIILLSEFVLQSFTLAAKEAKNALNQIAPRIYALRERILRYENVDDRTKKILHDVFRVMALHFLEQGNNKEAEDFIETTLFYRDFCGEANEIKAALLLDRNEPVKAVEFIEKALTSNESNQALFLRMIAYTMLGNEKEAFRDLDRLSKQGTPIILPELFESLDKFGRDEEFAHILEKMWGEVEKIDTERLDSAVKELTSNIIHRTFHAIEDKDRERLMHYSRMLSTIKQSIHREDMLRSFLLYLAEFFKERRYGTVLEMVKYLNQNLMGQDSGFLRPLEVALEFIQTKNTDILETLHKESRELVVDIIQRLSRDTVIPLTVYDSL